MSQKDANIVLSGCYNRTTLFLSLLIAFLSLIVSTCTCYDYKSELKIQNENLEVYKEEITLIKQQLEQSKAASYSAARTDLLDKVIERIYDEIDQKENIRNILSEGLIVRIISLTYFLKPYEIDSVYSSPERSLLLTILAQSNINDNDLKRIYNSADFRFGNFKNITISKGYLDNIDLSGSVFDNTKISYTSIKGAILDNIIFKNNCIFNYVNLSESEVNFSVEDTVYFNDVDFKSTCFNFCEANAIGFYNCDFHSSKLYKSRFRKIFYQQSNLERANILSPNCRTKNQGIKPFRDITMPIIHLNSFTQDKSGITFSDTIANTNCIDTIISDRHENFVNTRFFKNFNIFFSKKHPGKTIYTNSAPCL